ncbi:histone-lysine N-methyltransferase SETMAR, partial [Trichonephila clavata]
MVSHIRWTSASGGHTKSWTDAHGTTDANVGKVDDMIRANRRITIDEVAEELGISHERAQNIIHDILRYRKVLARWVPRQLISTHQEQRMAVSLEHLVRYHEDGNDFLFRIVTGVSERSSRQLPLQ